MHLVVTEEMPWGRLKKIAHTDRSPFSDHLRRYWWMLREDQSLLAMLKSVIDYGRCSDDRAYYRLSRIGLIKGEDSRSCMFRCKLYKEYFRSRI